jgi:hypothetical protein
MPPTYKQNKVHIYKWREQNRERKKELDRIHQRKRYFWKVESKIYLNILL